MQSISHISPRYVWNRAAVWHYQRGHPEAPWLTAQAISCLNTLLQPMDRGLEYGSGRSTMWFSQRTAHLSSVETSRAWYMRVAERLQQRRLADKVNLHLVEADENRPRDPERHTYLSFLESAGPLDYVLVDAIYRGECAVRAVNVLRPGGLLIVDNIERYLPETLSRSPERIRGNASPVWSEFQSRVAAWRRLWTSNGVFDTAIWIKTN